MLTICALCNKQVTTKNPYQDENGDFYCDDCVEDNEFVIAFQNSQLEILED